MKKIAVILVIGAAFIGFFLFEVHELLTLTGIKSLQDQVAEWKNGYPLLSGFGFMLSYVVVTALSLPGAALMTLAAGAFFGLGWGTVIVSFASSVGATIAFLVARFVLRDSVQARYGDRLERVNEGFRRDGAFYLFALRLVPLFPFFLINLVMGLTPVRTFTFYWVSQAGMLAGTLVYVNAGTQLAKVESVAGIFSPSLVLSFALLGVFPLLAKWALGQLNRRR